MGTSKPMTLVPLFDLKFLDEFAASSQELQIGGTYARGSSPARCPDCGGGQNEEEKVGWLVRPRGARQHGPKTGSSLGVP